MDIINDLFGFDQLNSNKEKIHKYSVIAIIKSEFVLRDEIGKLKQVKINAENRNWKVKDTVYLKN